MNVYFLSYSRPFFEDKDSLGSIREKILNELENLPNPEVEFEIVSTRKSRTRHQVFQGRLISPFIKSVSFNWLCSESDTLFNLPNRIEKIWMMLQMLSCCTTMTLDGPLVNFEKFSPITNRLLILASMSDGSTLRELPNDMLRLIAKIMLVCDLKSNADAFVQAVKESNISAKSLSYLLRTSESEDLT